MSAWIVTDEHISAIVQVAKHGPRDGDYGDAHPGSGHAFQWFHDGEWRTLGRDVSEQEAGRMLLVENIRSVAYRYEDNDEVDSAEAMIAGLDYRYERHPYRLTIGECAAALRCYEYQSCEHPEWEGSEAFAFCQSLKDELLRRTPGSPDAPWGIESGWLDEQAGVAA